MTRHLGSMLLALTSAALSLAAPGAIAQTASVPISQAEGSNKWFIELAGAPVADGNSATNVRNEKAAFRRAAAAAGIVYGERRSFDTLFNGFSVEATPTERVKLARLPGFKAMWPIETIQAPQPELGGTGAAADMAAAVAMTGANIAQANGWTGAGVKVGIIDTGIDIDHPAFGGGGVPGATPFPSARVAYGYDFVGDSYNADSTSASYNPVPLPDGNPDDCAGHGTHVAGIVGANGAVKGVAPGVTFGAYRVFGCAGSTDSDIILAALERAHADGMQVINQSLGSSRQWPQYPTAMATTRLAKFGVVVVASIGNSGPGGSAPDGLYSAGAPGVGEKVIGVASFDNSASTQLAFTVAPSGETIAYNRATGSPPSPTSGSLPMARTGTATTAADACTALSAGSLTGTAVLIRRGTCGFNQKAANAQAAGAAAVVLYNNTAGELNATVATGVTITIPVVSVNQANGALLNGKIAAGATTLTWTAGTVSTPIATAGLISSFSSFGLAADLSLKPNIGAPGGSIYSTYPLEAGAYATLSGTSMSSPHVAGGVALLLQARPKTQVDEVKTLLQNSADPKLWAGNPGLGFLDNVHRQGAGMLDIAGAIAATTTVEPSELALGESANGPVKRRLQIKNGSNAGVTYDVTHVPALATGPFTFVQAPGLTYANAPASVTFSKTSFTVQAASNENLDVTIAAPANAALADKGIYGGYIVLTPQGGGAALRVPYAGFKGDYQAIQVLAPTANGFPWLTKLVGANLVNQPAGASYSLVGSDIPYFAIHFDHHSEMVLLEALDATSGAVRGRVSMDEWMTRNSSPTGIFAFTWDGSLFKNDPSKPNQWDNAPNGTYKVRVTVKKALADKNNAAHYETWTSPVITIARP